MASVATRFGPLPPARYSCNVAVPRHRVVTGGGVGAFPPPRTLPYGGPLTIFFTNCKPVTRPHSEISWHRLWGVLHSPSLCHVPEAVQRLGAAAGGATGGFATGSWRHPCIDETLRLIHPVAPAHNRCYCHRRGYSGCYIRRVGRTRAPRPLAGTDNSSNDAVVSGLSFLVAIASSRTTPDCHCLPAIVPVTSTCSWVHSSLMIARPLTVLHCPTCCPRVGCLVTTPTATAAAAAAAAASLMWPRNGMTGGFIGFRIIASLPHEPILHPRILDDLVVEAASMSEDIFSLVARFLIATILLTRHVFNSVGILIRIAHLDVLRADVGIATQVHPPRIVVDHAVVRHIVVHSAVKVDHLAPSPAPYTATRGVYATSRQVCFTVVDPR